jgi:two-component system, LytTR family, sensor kinase
MKNYQISAKTIGWHLVFWVCVFLYEWLPASSIHECSAVAFNAACLNVPIIMVATYLTIFAVERLVFTKRYWLFATYMAASLVIFGFLRRTVNYYTIVTELYPQKATTVFKPDRLTLDAVNVMLFAIMGTMIYVVRKWMEQQRVNEMLMKEKVAAELSLLRSQVQPHFIFNTLNNIYMLSLKNSPMTSDMIYRLSSLLSYMLYDSKKQVIEVEKELDYVKNYINLEKIRYGERLDVQMTVFPTVRNFQVPPLLFLPLVENAFKHGVSNEVQDSWIHIDVTVNKNVLTFKIENSVAKAKSSIDGFGSGLGLDNLQKRLEILYPNSYELKCMQEDDVHLAVLKLDFGKITEGGKKRSSLQQTTESLSSSLSPTTGWAMALKTLFVSLWH